ncbi:MAG: phytanoyl-CoA dioxygenase family protein [Armatimonadota bacterium]|nr:phytanoyl-CoA dioxygenase family protein [Armatimonadota bacterium]
MILSDAQREQFIRDGYVIARGLIPPQIVRQTREAMLDALGMTLTETQTWTHQSIPLEVEPLTVPCRTEGVEAVARELVGPDILPGICDSPYMDTQGIKPAITRGFIPVLNFPSPGPRQFEPPTSGYHIDGMDWVTLWPGKFFLVVFAYLTDTPEFGGATTILPGSHRQVFEHWQSTGQPGSTTPPDLDYAAPVPMPGEAGDVIFMHYLAVHSGSANHSDYIRVGLNTAVMPDPSRPYQPKTGPPQADWTPPDWTLRTDTLP